MVVISEAKLSTHNKFHHAVAQVIGYYIALLSDVGSPPLVFVLSEANIQLAMFPFEDHENDKLVNAVRFVEVPLWLSNYSIDFNISALGIVYLVLRITIEEMMSKKFLTYAYSDAVKKRNIIVDVTSLDDIIKKHFRGVQTH